VRVTSRLVALAVVGLLVAAGVAFAIGRATASESESSGAAGVPEIDVPTAVSDTPVLRDVGGLPDLRAAPPASGSGGAVSTPDSTPSDSIPPPAEPPTSEPPTSEPPTSEPPPPDPVAPAPPPPPPPGEG
jgi:hypothetical protein